MAARKNKKPRHTHIVVPGVESKKKSRRRGAANPRPAVQEPLGGEEQPAEGPLPEAEAPAGAATPEQGEPRTRANNPRVLLLKRKRRARRIRLLALLVAALLLFTVLLSGAYMHAVVKGAELLEGIRTGLQSGEGFPMSFEMPGYRESEAMGTTAFAVLGEKDMAIVSGKGRELYRIQHGYANPHITAGNTRVCVYNRGGTGYTIEGRDRRLQAMNTDQAIEFCEMSPGGLLAVVTYSRYRYTLRVYDYIMSEEPLISIPYVDEYPYMLSFLSDDKHFALATMSVEGGAFTTNIQLLHTGRDSVQGTISGGQAVALQLHYLSSNRILVVYDSYTALYDAKGRELARYDYGGAELYTAATSGSMTALVFKTVSHSQLQTVLLDANLAVTGEALTETSDEPKVLISGKNAILLAGYYVYTYTSAGEMLAAYEADSTGYSLVGAAQPLLLASGQVLPLGWMLRAGGEPPWLATSLPEGTTSLAGEQTSLPDEPASQDEDLRGTTTSLPEDAGDAPAE